MAPLRRYLRISKYSVLECRIYLDNPALAQSWLLNPRNPILPRVIESIRPLVLPKLREEKERSRKKSSKKKKAIKDVVVQDDFEVSMFLTETSTRHSLLSKKKYFREKLPKMRSNSSKLIAETSEAPVDIDDVPMLREDSDDDNIQLADIPLARSDLDTKSRNKSGSIPNVEDTEDAEQTVVEIGSDDEDPLQGRGKALGDGADGDDKKKMAMDISYDGFAIYGQVLCLVIRRRETASQTGRARAAGSVNAKLGGQAKMENWITSTQMPAGEAPV